jgi:hypothetical protein
MCVTIAVLLTVAAAGCGGSRDKHASTATPHATPAAAAPRSPTTGSARGARSPDAVLRWLTGRRVRIEGRSVRIDPSTLTCGGVGRSSRRHGTRVWSRFRCIQPTLSAGSVAGPDAIFFVEPAGRRSFAIAGGHFTAY